MNGQPKKPANQTTHNYTNWMVTAFDQLDLFDPTKWPSFRYCCYQREICPTTAREHIQGYVIFSKRMSLSSLKKLDGTAHWEPRRGTHEQAQSYCSKDDTRKANTTPVEVGDPPKPGKRTDLHDVADAITAGESLRDLCINHTPAMIKYSKGVQLVKMMISDKRRWDMDVIVLYGPTGLGKSELADYLAPEAYRVPLASDKNTLWFDGYSGEEDVIIEEFEGYRCTYSFLKEFLDRYPIMVPTKGGHANFSAKRVILTSNTPPELWYKWNEKRTFAPLERRFTRVLEFDADHHYKVIKGEDPLNTSVSPPSSPKVSYDTEEEMVNIPSPVRTGVADKEPITCLDCGFQYQSDESTPTCGRCAEREKKNVEARKKKKRSKKVLDNTDTTQIHLAPPPEKPPKKKTKKAFN